MALAITHPVILIYVCKLHDIKCPTVDEYNSNREDNSLPDKRRAEAKTHILKCINRDI